MDSEIARHVFNQVEMYRFWLNRAKSYRYPDLAGQAYGRAYALRERIYDRFGILLL
jgi:hypothetical protein